MQFASEKVYQVGLSLIPKIGDILIKQLVSYCGSAENVFKAPKSKLLKIKLLNIKKGSLDSCALLNNKSAF